LAAIAVTEVLSTICRVPGAAPAVVMSETATTAVMTSATALDLLSLRLMGEVMFPPWVPKPIFVPHPSRPRAVLVAGKPNWSGDPAGKGKRSTASAAGCVREVPTL
jgi:hypothetical protein